MRKILVIRFSAMGDVAMTSPVVTSVAKAHPDTQIVVLTQGWLTALFEGEKNVSTIGINFNDYKGLTGLYRLFKMLKSQQFDKVVDLHNVLRSKVLTTLFKLNGTPCYIVNKGRNEKKALLTQIRMPLKAMMERYRETFIQAGYNVVLPTRAEKQLRAIPQEILDIAGEKMGHWWGIAPFAQHEGKRMPIYMFKEVVASLAKEENDRVFLFSGGGEEKDIVDEIASSYNNVFAVFGRVRIKGELDLMANLDTLVSMDSGAMHFASIVGCRVVSVWGATHFWAGFLGWGQSRKDVIQIDLECRPCSIYGNKPCKLGDYRCLTSISSEDIVAKVLENHDIKRYDISR